jgi:hypothetical protein
MRPKGVKAGNAIPVRVKGVRSQTLSLDWGWVGCGMGGRWKKYADNAAENFLVNQDNDF